MGRLRNQLVWLSIFSCVLSIASTSQAIESPEYSFLPSARTAAVICPVRDHNTAVLGGGQSNPTILQYFGFTRQWKSFLNVSGLPVGLSVARSYMTSSEAVSFLSTNETLYMISRSTLSPEFEHEPISFGFALCILSHGRTTSGTISNIIDVIVMQINQHFNYGVGIIGSISHTGALSRINHVQLSFAPYGLLMIAGGRLPNNAYTAHVQLINLNFYNASFHIGLPFGTTTSLNTISTFMQLSEARGSSCGCTISMTNPNNNVINMFGMIAGGISSFGVSDVVDVYNVIDETWSTYTLPQPRMAMACTFLDDTNMVYLSGGSDGNTLRTTIFTFDILSFSWTTFTTIALSNARMNHASLVFNNRVYFVMGQLIDGSGSNAIDIYDPSAHSIITVIDFVPRKDTAVAALDSSLIIVGGLMSGSVESSIVTLFTNRLRWAGPWSSNMTYSTNDIVEWKGSTYVATRQIASNSNEEIYPDLTQWSLLSSKGDRGEKGDQGEQGEEGEMGPKGDIGITGPQGERGDDPDYHMINDTIQNIFYDWVIDATINLDHRFSTSEHTLISWINESISAYGIEYTKLNMEWMSFQLQSISNITYVSNLVSYVNEKVDVILSDVLQREQTQLLLRQVDLNDTDRRLTEMYRWFESQLLANVNFNHLLRQQVDNTTYRVTVLNDQIIHAIDDMDNFIALINKTTNHIIETSHELIESNTRILMDQINQLQNNSDDINDMEDGMNIITRDLLNLEGRYNNTIDVIYSQVTQLSHNISGLLSTRPIVELNVPSRLEIIENQTTHLLSQMDSSIQHMSMMDGQIYSINITAQTAQNNGLESRDAIRNILQELAYVRQENRQLLDALSSIDARCLNSTIQNENSEGRRRLMTTPCPIQNTADSLHSTGFDRTVETKQLEISQIFTIVGLSIGSCLAIGIIIWRVFVWKDQDNNKSIVITKSQKTDV